MKLRDGFVSNSSSTAFMITNKSNKRKNLADFAEETKHLVKEFNAEYDNNIDVNDFIGSANNCANDVVWEPGEQKLCAFGDESQLAHEIVYDYMLRDKDQSKSFKWQFEEYWR